MDILINSLPALLAVIVTFLLTQYSNFAKQRNLKKPCALFFIVQFKVSLLFIPIIPTLHFLGITPFGISTISILLNYFLMNFCCFMS